MPRNGDGSSDNGPIDANNVVHGGPGADVRFLFQSPIQYTNKSNVGHAQAHQERRTDARSREGRR
ncbi:hypothetical protein P280DRAFT_466346 [Massarina eburnea CBS 473.64]|uniref:Uncharacterized protein n=1 Tax=Massarina eburnea CBS 473.64 TaxID=1395130 RepID=A0A6A6SE38_9PLEO|nr:hypothetical protein P280DRAFT_466346 [Massarina eburnea CBS 473.64]